MWLMYDLQSSKNDSIILKFKLYKIVLALCLESYKLATLAKLASDTSKYFK